MPNASSLSFSGAVATFLLAGGFLLSLDAQQPPASAPPAPIAAHKTFVTRYCASCHNDRLKRGGLSLDAAAALDIGEHPDVWEKVLRKVRARQMPPVGLPRPDEATYNGEITTLETSLDRAAAASPNPGRTATLRRLTRTEYQNAIHDLLALDVDVSSLLPADESSYGFDNVTVGDLSPTLLDRYINAAEKISRVAVGRPSVSPDGETIRIPADLTQEGHIDGLPIGTRGGALIKYTFPMEGEYEIQIRLTRDRNEHVEGLNDAADLELLIDRERVQLFTVKPPAHDAGFSDDYQPNHDNVDRDLHIRVPMKPGPHAVGVAFVKTPTALIETARQPYQAHFNSYRHPRLQPAVYSIAIIGPYAAKGPGDTPSRRKLLVARPTGPNDEDAAARTILASVMRRAYRRPVTDGDVQGAFDLYKQAKANASEPGVAGAPGEPPRVNRAASRFDGFNAGIEMALSAVLVSPEFLFRVEQDPRGAAPNTPYRISDLELASRLSFFLWSSIPDDELLDVAVAGKLHEPATLERQVKRMLADNRSRSLVTNFASQWLHLRNLDSMTPDMRLFPDFDDNLRQAFRQETELFFESILREDRSALDLLRANYTFVNERLAKHYGIPHIYGTRFRRIELGEDSGRGGLLRQASILTVTSYATRTSPVIRGKWVLDNLLGVPPPPPLPDVPALKDNTVDGNLTVRKRLAEHRTNAVCASCHNLMDPVGLSMEKFDAIGRRRADEDGVPIDASGGLPDGSHFADVAGLEKALLSRPEIFVGTFAEKLLTYGLGRGVEYYDAPAIRTIVRDSRTQDFRVSSLILGIVKSAPFQMRMSR
jgi:mono/diheme cytochrome c family protein